MNKRKKIILLVALILAAIFGGAVAASASVVQVRPHTRLVQPLKVTYYEYLSLNRVYVEFNNGSAWRAGPCPEEDSPNCWWNAQTSGTGGGRSFIDLDGTAYYLDGQYPYSCC